MSPPRRTHTDYFDVVIHGGGAGAKLIWGSVGNRSVAVVEQSRVSGACPVVACVPSMLRTARVWQLGADLQQSALFTGRVPAAEAYRLACERRDAIVHHRDDALHAQALQRTGAVLVRGHGQVREPGLSTSTGTRCATGTR
ncbi:MAG: pyridine nucleotide-disulfide oxidoreductase dimerization region [Mycobacterium sp.]|nr:pyridine nucleotide-disulfide oxidoreductase dimerization region [Mycobacterium sp.]